MVIFEDKIIFTSSEYGFALAHHGDKSKGMARAMEKAAKQNGFDVKVSFKNGFEVEYAGIKKSAVHAITFKREYHETFLRLDYRCLAIHIDYLLEREADIRCQDGENYDYDWHYTKDVELEYTEAVCDTLSDWLDVDIIANGGLRENGWGSAFIDVKLGDINSLTSENLQNTFADLFTRREGFIPFEKPIMPNKPRDQWNQRQIFALLENALRCEKGENWQHELDCDMQEHYACGNGYIMGDAIERAFNG